MKNPSAARTKSKAGMPMPIPIFAPVGSPLELCDAPVGLLEAPFPDAIPESVWDVPDVVAGGPAVNAATSLLFQSTTTPSPYIAVTEPEGPPSIVGKGELGLVDVQTPAPILLGLL